MGTNTEGKPRDRVRSREAKGNSLEQTAPELKVDREVVLEAINQNGDALKHAAPEQKAFSLFEDSGIEKTKNELVNSTLSVSPNEDSGIGLTTNELVRQ